MLSKTKGARPYIDKSGRTAKGGGGGGGKLKNKMAGKASKAQKDALAVTEENLARIEAQEAEQAPTAAAADATEDRVPVSEVVAPKGKGAKPKQGGQPKAAKPAKTAKAPKEPKAPKPRKTSALDAAAIVLSKAGKAMNAKDIISAMAEQGLWTSPAGRTPHSTLHAALCREIKDKGTKSRFTKAERGLFASNA